MYAKRLFVNALVLGLILSIMLPIVIIVLVIESKPAVQESQTVSSDGAVRTRLFVKTVIQSLIEENDRPFTISATEKELNGLFAFAHRSISKIRGKTIISSRLFRAMATIEIPHTPMGDFINLHLHLVPSESGFYISHAAVGDLMLSDSVVRFFAGLFLNLSFGFDEGSKLLNSIDAVKLTPSRIDIRMKVIPNINQLVEKMRGRIRFVRNEMAFMGDPIKVRNYYAEIMNLTEKIPPAAEVSLSYYIGGLFKVAEKNGGDPVVENRAAILALGIYFGSWRVEQMVGDVRTDEMKRHHRRTNDVGLAGREDLRLHFLISAALEIASERGITHAIGEFKELLDARDGGSGFSFVDLAADRAGVRFSEAATHPSSAKRLQILLANDSNEDQFFPNVENLPEGLSKDVFEDYFGDVESQAYRSLVSEVDACLKKLPAYNLVDEGFTSQGCDIVYLVPEELLGLNPSD